MAVNWEELLSVLSAEKALYQELIALAQEKQGNIIANDLEELANTVAKEEELLKKIDKKEQQRKKALSQQEESFKKVCEKAPADLVAALKKIRQDLLNILEELWEINATNGRLITDSLQLNNNTLQSLNRLKTSRTYNPHEKKSLSNLNLIDKKA